MHVMTLLRRSAIPLVAATTLAACTTGPVPQPGPAGPPAGTILHFKRTADTPGAPTEETFDHHIVRSAGNVLVYHVQNESERPSNDEVRLFRGLFSYAYWRPGQGWVEYQFDRSVAAKLWPLEVGNRVTFPATFGYGNADTEAEARRRWRPTERGTITWSVEGRERITVAAGSYDTVVISRARDFSTIDRPERRVMIDYRTWYAPALGYVVKQTMQTRSVAEPGADEETGPVVTIELQNVWYNPPLG